MYKLSNPMKFAAYAFAALVTIGAAGGAIAHGGATGIVKQRMDAMSNLADTMKKLAGMMRGQVPYSPIVVRKSAKKIAGHSGDALTRLFPEGSIKGPSEARHAIWADWDTFKRYSVQMEVLANGLASAANNGLAANSAASGALQDANTEAPEIMRTGAMTHDAEKLASMPADGLFTLIARTCSSCHEKFRLKK